MVDYCFHSSVKLNARESAKSLLSHNVFYFFTISISSISCPVQCFAIRGRVQGLPVLSAHSSVLSPPVPCPLPPVQSCVCCRCLCRNAANVQVTSKFTFEFNAKGKKCYARTSPTRRYSALYCSMMSNDC